MACANACPKGAIDIGINKYGYEKVVIDNGKCVDCGLCAKVCARRMQIERHSPIKCYAGQSRDSEKLKHSASGAAFQMLAEIVLEMGGVCYGCAGKMINGEYSAYHVRVTNVDELQSILNSKYILSHIGTTYQQIKEDLKNGKLVLFGGTPCQALGLKSFLNNEYVKVCNIVPLQKNQLTIEEYNQLLDLFYNDIAKVYGQTHDDIKVVGPSTGCFNPLDYISESALNKLTLFCNTANKSTGSSHPCDEERWFDFICQTVDDGRVFDYDTLSKFLQDEEYWGKKEKGFLGVIGQFAWSDENAQELASEYDNYVRILQYYKKTRLGE